MGLSSFYIHGSINEAAALGLILIVLGASCLFVITKVAGTKMGGAFRIGNLCFCRR
jgi:ABC-type Fe3+ transport system permease subunit